MIRELDQPPETVFVEACDLIHGCLGSEEVSRLEIAPRPIPVHRLRPAKSGGWAASVPQVGWAFPLLRNGELAYFAWVAIDTDTPLGCAVTDAGPETGIAEAFRTATGLGEATDEPCRFRLVQVPGSLEAFWISGENDTFVDIADAVVLSGPEFVARIQEQLSAPFDDLIWDSEGSASDASQPDEGEGRTDTAESGADEVEGGAQGSETDAE